jgi:Notch-like protein
LKCDEDVDECLMDPCSRKEVCKNSIGSYQCVCTGGRSGRQCMNDFDECSLNPCGSKMTCINEGNSYKKFWNSIG